MSSFRFHPVKSRRPTTEAAAFWPPRLEARHPSSSVGANTGRGTPSAGPKPRSQAHPPHSGAFGGRAGTPAEHAAGLEACSETTEECSALRAESTALRAESAALFKECAARRAERAALFQECSGALPNRAGAFARHSRARPDRAAKPPARAPRCPRPPLHAPAPADRNRHNKGGRVPRRPVLGLSRKGQEPRAQPKSNPRFRSQARRHIETNNNHPGDTACEHTRRPSSPGPRPHDPGPAGHATRPRVG